MKHSIYCPRCACRGRKPKLLAKCEGVKGEGVVYLWCKRCNADVPVRIDVLENETNSSS